MRLDVVGTNLFPSEPCSTPETLAPIRLENEILHPFPGFSSSRVRLRVPFWRIQKFVEAKGVAPKSYKLAGGSGKVHEVFFCETCGTYVWSVYHGAPGKALFIRAGTLDKPDAVKPDVHIFTRSKLPWLKLPDDARSFKAFYKLDEVWSPESKARLRLNRADKS